MTSNRPRIAAGHAPSVVRDLALAILGIHLSLGRDIGTLRRFAIVNPACHRWGTSDWFAPYYRADIDGIVEGYWVSKRDFAIYHITDLAPSLPVWRSGERLACVRATDDATLPDDSLGHATQRIGPWGDTLPVY